MNVDFMYVLSKFYIKSDKAWLSKKAFLKIYSKTPCIPVWINIMTKEWE